MSRGGATRFAPGQSGNPTGRPKKKASQQSAFDVIIDQTLTVTQNGMERELTIDEALQLQTYQAALKGGRAARREVLKMIAKREKWIAERTAVKQSPVKTSMAYDPDNANAAMLLLGIVSRDPCDYGPNNTYERLKLEPWAVEAALVRGRRRVLEDKHIADIKRCTRDPKSIRWP